MAKSKLSDIEKKRLERALKSMLTSLPEKIITSDIAKISKDNYDQFFVRFPTKISDMMDLKPNYTLEFIVERKMNDIKQNKKIDVFKCRIIRKSKKEARMEMR